MYEMARYNNSVLKPWGKVIISKVACVQVYKHLLGESLGGSDFIILSGGVTAQSSAWSRDWEFGMKDWAEGHT